MSRITIDYTGFENGRLKVTGRCPWRIDYWMCDCSCGTKGHLVRKNNLKKTKSCGCLRDEKVAKAVKNYHKKRASMKEAKII